MPFYEMAQSEYAVGRVELLVFAACSEPPLSLRRESTVGIFIKAQDVYCVYHRE